MSKNEEPKTAHVPVAPGAGRTNIAVLLGFTQHPADDQSIAGLISAHDTSCFASTIADLPHGGWSSQGMCECAIEVEASAERPWDSTQWSPRAERHAMN